MEVESTRIHLKQRLVRFLYPYGAVRRVLRGPVKGFRYVVAPGMGLTYALGVDSWNWRFLLRHVLPGMTIYDIGANRGQMTLFFAHLVGSSGTVISYEPEPDVYSTLMRNIELNSLRNVTAFQSALADADGVGSFAYSECHSTQGKLLNVEKTYEIPEAFLHDVMVTRLDSVVSEGVPPPQLIKIDVEGGAALLLRGAVEVLEKHSPKIYVELHGSEEQAGIRDELLTRGYVAETIDGINVPDPTDGWYSPLWCYRAS